MTHSHEESGYASQRYTGSKKLSTINEIPPGEAINVEIDEPPTIAQKVPQKSQWETLRNGPMQLGHFPSIVSFPSLEARNVTCNSHSLSDCRGGQRAVPSSGPSTPHYRIDFDGGRRLAI